MLISSGQHSRHIFATVTKSFLIKQHRDERQQGLA